MTAVRPVRFTDDIPAMQEFLEGFGLQPRISSNRPGWVDLVGASGLVALHAARDSTAGAAYDAMLRALGAGHSEVDVQPTGEGEKPGVQLALVVDGHDDIDVTDPDGQTVSVRPR